MGKAVFWFISMALVWETYSLAQVAGDGNFIPQVPFGVVDRGIFSDLDERVRVRILPSEKGETPKLWVDKKNKTLSVLFNGVPVKTYSVPLRSADVLEIGALVGGKLDIEGVPLMPKDADMDGDGIPNQVDILVGAKKTVLNSASYDASYQILPYPGGDVPRSIGCCADVVIRALRNAGLDLQKAIYKDILTRPKSYRHVKSPNRNIDHRRVRNMKIYMKKHFRVITAKDRDESNMPWQPGDIVLFDTLSKAGPDHIGIVSDSLGESGLPLVINNWTVGSTTAPLDLLGWCPVTDHFRIR